MPTKATAAIRSVEFAQANEASAHEIANELGVSLEEYFSMLTVKLGLRRDELSLIDIGRRAGAAPASQPRLPRPAKASA